MDWTTEARQAQHRTIAHFRAHPEQARATLSGVAELRNGLACVYQQDGRSIVIDMPAAVGGTEKGPTPGFFGRAALSSCIAIGIQMTALRDGVRLDAIKVTLDQDWDDRGLLELGDAEPGPLAARVGIEVESAAPRHAIDDIVARALRHDPWLIAYTRAQQLSTTLTVRPPGR